MKRSLLFSMFVLLAASVANAKGVPTGAMRVATSTWSDVVSKDRLDAKTGAPLLRSSAVANTLVLATYPFNSGGTCTPQGWTTVDVGPLAAGPYFFGLDSYTQTGDYWHVDDFAASNSLGTIPAGLITAGGMTFTPVEGAKSMWMGQRIPPAGPVDTIHCSYVALPGYGTHWRQSFGTKNCISVTGGLLDVAFKAKFDVETSYDGTSLEYTTDCTGNTGWIKIDGGIHLWTGAQTITVAKTYNIGVTGPVRVRFHFVSDLTFDNQAGNYPGFGVAIDNLSIEGSPVEDFEDEPVGAHETADWTSLVVGYGDYLGLFKKTTGANYEDECSANTSCYWAAIQGSTEFYGCGTPPQPAQKVVPYANVRGEYLSNEIWSPVIPLSGSGNEFRLRYSVYRDLPFDNLVFHQWHVRSIPASGCPGPWRDRDLFYYGDTKDWAVVEHAVGQFLDPNTSVAMQVAIGVIDMCAFWCGTLGSGACHSPGGYIDNVQVMRIDTVGPQWDVREIDTYQDTFAANGTLTGTARVDTAFDTKPAASPNFTPGDSSVVLSIVDPKHIVGTNLNANGLLNDPTLSTFVGRHKTKKQAYMYVAVWPLGQPGKSGAPLSDGPGGTANRYPFSGTVAVDGVTWTKIRMDFTYRGTATNAGIGDTSSDTFVRDRFNVDLNDNLFTPGDTICYFFGATSADGTTYYSTEYGPTANISEVAANPMELTILPAGGFNRGGGILYVDGADGLGNQPYFEGAFMVLGFEDLIDRYDVRGPSSALPNRLAGRVSNVVNQLNAAYNNGIIWDCGSLSATLGDGSGNPLKTDDYNLLNTYLANLSLSGGLYLCGDDVAQNLAASASASALAFKASYMPFTLVSGNHRTAGLGVSPAVVFWPGRTFNDSFIAFGGCPELNDFDVMNATGTSSVEMSYGASQSPNGAAVRNLNGNARVLLSGFSFANIRDDEVDGMSDRAAHLARIIAFVFSTDTGVPTGADRALSNALSQNYPNPFNPSTTIAYSIKARGHVSLGVYNVAGQLVRTLANEARASGPHTVTWDGRDNAGTPVSSGVYFYRLIAGEFSATRKMVLLK